MVRVKRRHLLVEVTTCDPELDRMQSLPITERDLLVALRHAVLTIHGDFGLGSVLRSLHVKKFSSVTRVAVVSVGRGAHLLLTTALPFVRQIKDMNCSLRMVYLSGTIRGCLRFLQKYYHRQVRGFNSDLAMVRKGFQELQDKLANERVNDEEDT
jgi:RNase P/RNase MRP subunit POP5